MDITCISDLHGHYPELEGGDLLIVAGDLTARDTHQQVSQFLEWIEAQKYDRLVFIGGNHDNSLTNWCTTEQSDNMMSYDEFHKWEYLCDSGTEFEGLKIYGSPWTLAFPGINPHCTAFTGTEAELEAKFALIPDDIDILITHGPPLGIFDTTDRGENVGSKSLLEKARSLKNLKLFVFGRLHEGYGMITPSSLNDGAKVQPNKPITCASFPYIVNCSHVNEHYEPVNKPVRIVL